MTYYCLVSTLIVYTITLKITLTPHSSTLAWRIAWAEEPDGLQSMGSQESDTTEQLHFHFSLSCTGEGNGNPLQSSCLEDPRDRGAWWAAVSGVTQSRTRLKRLSSSRELRSPHAAKTKNKTRLSKNDLYELTCMQ